MKKIKVGILGGGNMGEAIAVAIKKDFALSVCEQDNAKATFLKKKLGLRLTDLKDLLTSSSVIILAVKPQNFEEVLSELKSYNISKKLFISIAAGITTEFIQERLGEKIKVVRAMPNLPAKVKAAMTGLCAGSKATSVDLNLANRIFSLIGEVVIVDETFMDAVTAVSGSGPAYVFLFLEILQEAAKSLGLDDKTSAVLVYQTLLGSLKLYAHEMEDPAILRERVTSKGGTTEAALKVLNEKNFAVILIEAIKRAQQRAKELSK